MRFEETAMARSRKESIRLIEALTPEVAQSTVRAFCYPEDQAVEHWCAETVTYLNRISGLANTKSGRLGLKDLNDLLWDFPMGKKSDRIHQLNQAVAHVGKEPSRHDLAELKSTFHNMSHLVLIQIKINKGMIADLLRHHKVT
jgi:hypothetical protein